MKWSCVVFISVNDPLKEDHIPVLNVRTSKYVGEQKKKKKYVALTVHVNMNICKFRNVYDATHVANAVH